MASLSAWIRASRPLAQLNIVIPLFVAQAAAWHVTGEFSLSVCVLVLAWGVFDALFIVYANDVADQETDTTDRTAVSGGSGVLVDKVLSPASLARAAIAAACGVLACSALLAVAGRPWAIAGGGVAILLLWAYSFPPLRMCNHVGGEWFQATGMGLGLPWLAYYAQTGVLLPPWWLLIPCFLLGYASNVVTSMPDMLADQAAHKRTWTVRHGKASAKYISAFFIVAAAVVAALGTERLISQQRLVIVLLPAVILASTMRRRAEPFHDSAFVWVAATALNLVFVLWGIFMVLSGMGR